MGKWKSLAFPVPEDSTEDGMELRDYFAAKAMHALIMNSQTNGYITDIIHVAYRYADGAMEVREQ
jgi:hypothetical protein